jgi:hypothetical protein
MPSSISRCALQSEEKHEVKFVVRAPDSHSRERWVTVGVAFGRKTGAGGFLVKLKTLPPGCWDGTLTLLPLLVAKTDESQQI